MKTAQTLTLLSLVATKKRENIMKFSLNELIALRELLAEKEKEYNEKRKLLKSDFSLSDEEYQQASSRVYEKYNVYLTMLGKLDNAEF